MAVIGTNSAVGKIEVHQVTSLQDLRSRIVRCDQALSKHTADISNCRSEINGTVREQQTMKENLKEHIHRVEAEVSGTAEYLEYILSLWISNPCFMTKIRFRSSKSQIMKDIFECENLIISMRRLRWKGRAWEQEVWQSTCTYL